MRNWTAQRPRRTNRKRNEHGNKHEPEIEKTKKLGRSVLEDLGRSGAKTEHQTEKGAKHSKKWAWEVRFAGFRHLSDQNGPPERETNTETNTGQR